MSGKPYPAGVREVRNEARELHKLRNQIAELNDVIKEAQASINTLSAEHTKRSEKMMKLVREMDVVSAGNYGWENRMHWFLCELVTGEGNNV